MRIFTPLLIACALCACSPPSSSTDTPSATAPPAATAGILPTAGGAHVMSPIAGSTVTSPLHITGVAPANWFFENSFPVRLEDAQGQIITQAPATPRVNWTQPGDKEFDATLTFVATGPATLVLEEDMPANEAAPREVRIPVVLAH